MFVVILVSLLLRVITGEPSSDYLPAGEPSSDYNTAGEPSSDYILDCLMKCHDKYHEIPWSSELAVRAGQVMERQEIGNIDDSEDYVDGLMLIKLVTKRVSTQEWECSV